MSRSIYWRSSGLRKLSPILLLLVAGPAVGELRDSLNVGVAQARRNAPELGVHIRDLTTGETVYEYEADTLRILASNTKLLTSAAALDALPAGYFFETGVSVRGTVSAGTLRGDVGIVGGGDPNISGRHFQGDSLAVFRRWARELGGRGIRRIEGDLYLAHGVFDAEYVHPEWPRDQLSRWYEAPVSGLSFNDNCVLVRVWPGSAVGRPARVEMVPELPIFKIRNSAVTGSSSRRHWVAIDRPAPDNVIAVSGSVYRNAGPVEAWIAVPDPLTYFGAAVRKAFAEEGIELSGEPRPVAELPLGAWERVTMHRSDLLTTLEVINKRSQNFYAESLLKLLGSKLCGRGDWASGTRAVAEFLDRIGIEPGTYEIADGSGMSRGNRMTAREMTKLLQHMFLHPAGPEFVRSLPFSGEEGLRWERRLAEEKYRGNVLAKTGSLNGVSTLSGYAKSASGKVYAFSILCNRTNGNWGARVAQDRILRVLVDQG